VQQSSDRVRAQQIPIVTKRLSLTETSVGYKIYWLQRLSYYTLQSNKMLKYYGVTVTMSDMNEDRPKMQKDKIFKVTNRKNGQMRFFMASAVKKWPNFSKLAMNWPISQPWSHSTKRLLP